MEFCSKFITGIYFCGQIPVAIPVGYTPFHGPRRRFQDILSTVRSWEDTEVSKKARLHRLVVGEIQGWNENHSAGQRLTNMVDIDVSVDDDRSFLFIVDYSHYS